MLLTPTVADVSLMVIPFQYYLGNQQVSYSCPVSRNRAMEGPPKFPSTHEKLLQLSRVRDMEVICMEEKFCWPTRPLLATPSLKT